MKLATWAFETAKSKQCRSQIPTEVPTLMSQTSTTAQISGAYFKEPNRKETQFTASPSIRPVYQG